MKHRSSSVIPDILVFYPNVYEDERGSFHESYRSCDFDEQLFIQGNISVSVPWTLRGLHWQTPNGQGKLVTCLTGSIQDVAVDMRPESKTYLSWHSEILNDSNHKLMWVPPGFAHGFLALERGATVSYECTTYYVDTNARSVRWNDPILKIEWLKTEDLVISEKDKNAPFLEGYDAKAWSDGRWDVV